MTLFQVSAKDSRELQAVILSLRAAEKNVQKEVRQQTQAVVSPIWTKAVNEHASTQLESRALAQTARVKISNQNVTLRAAAVRGGKLSGGVTPQSLARPAEFGAARNKKNTYTSHSRKGKAYQVTRRTQAQFRNFNKRGYVFYPSVAQVAPRVLALWAQTTVRVFVDAMNGKGGN